MTWFIAGAVIFTLIIMCAFFLTVRALLKQKKLSEIKSDFINNMTHEFKTPLATISLAVDALKNEKVLNDKSKMNYFIDYHTHIKDQYEFRDPFQKQVLSTHPLSHTPIHAVAAFVRFSMPAE